MSKWYWRDGTLAVDMSKPGWQKKLKAFEKKLYDKDYKRVAVTELPNGYWVSTVWLGLDHRFVESPMPLIFETMVFRGKSGRDYDMERYSTEADAIHGHNLMVKKWKAKNPFIVWLGEKLDDLKYKLERRWFHTGFVN